MDDVDVSGDPDPPPLTSRLPARIEIIDRTRHAPGGCGRASPCGTSASGNLDTRDPASSELAAPLSADSLAWIERMGSQALAELNATGELRVAIVADEEMALAHERDTGVSGTTDVLTYDLGEGAAASTRELDADVLVCYDEARRQSVARAIPVERELLLYILHAALHCLGYDDTDDASSEAMHAEEDRVLDAVGVGATFTTLSAAHDGGGAQ